MKEENILIRALKAFRQEDVKTYFRKILSFPYAFIKIKSFQYDNLNDLVDFCFNNLAGLIKPLQVKDEILELLKILNESKPEIIAEIGTASGGTLFLFSRVASENATIISIDLPGGMFGGGYSKVKIPLYQSFGSPKQNIHLIRSDSHDKKTLEKITNILGSKKIDFLIIDGDHTYEGVKNDFEMYSSLVKNNGIIAFHDIAILASATGCNVDKFWNQIKNKYKYLEIIKDPKQGNCGIGSLFLGISPDVLS